MNGTLELENVVTGFGIRKKVYKITKRSFDVLMAMLGVIVMIPIILVIKTSYLLSGDKKSIFYKQIRIGKDGKKFELFKFRSMVWNADEILKELLKKKNIKKSGIDIKRLIMIQELPKLVIY